MFTFVAQARKSVRWPVIKPDVSHARCDMQSEEGSDSRRQVAALPCCHGHGVRL